MISGLISICFLLFILSGCSNTGQDDSDAGFSVTQVTNAGGDTSQGKDGNAKKPPKEKSIKVDVGQIRQGDLVLPVFADGAIRAPQSVVVKAKMGGQLTAVLIRNGDQVKEGQLLARIDPREYQISLEESRYRHLLALSQIAAEIDTCKVNQAALDNFNAAKRKLDQQKERGSLGEDAYKNRLINLEMTALRRGAFREEVLQQRTGLATARMAEERARLNLDYTEIRAPFGGVVQNMTVVDGEILAIGAIICSVCNSRELEAVVNVLEADLGNLVEGRPALLVIPATEDTLETTIDVISPKLDAATRTCQLILRFDNPEGKLRAGMFVRAQIAGWIHYDKLLAPKDALLVRDSRALVFRKEGDRAKWMYVDTGLENDDWVEILKVHGGGALSPEDTVVVSDHLTLAHESKIKVRKSVPSEDRWAFATGTTAVKVAAVTKTTEAGSLYASRTRLLELGRFEEAWDVGWKLVSNYPESPEAALVLKKKPSGGTAGQGSISQK